MTMHLFATVLTHKGIAHNNRGESQGTIATLQKIMRDGDIYSTVSSEAIRYAIRESWQMTPEVQQEMNRTVGQAAHNPEGSDSAWKHKTFDPDADKGPKYVAGTYIDDDVLGYMNANGGFTRRSVLEVGRAVSTTPWDGTVEPHFATPGSNVSIGPNKTTKQYEPVPYGCEVHHTRYQYTFAMTPDALLKDKYARTQRTVIALHDIRRVGGAHARFSYDFAPEAIILRWTADPAPRIMFCFDQDDRGRLSLDTLRRRIAGKDVKGEQVYVGTAIDGIPELMPPPKAKASDPERKSPLAELGVNVFPGTRLAVDAVLAKVKADPTLKG